MSVALTDLDGKRNVDRPSLDRAGRRIVPTSLFLACPMELPTPQIENGITHPILLIPGDSLASSRVPFLFNTHDDGLCRIALDGPHVSVLTMSFRKRTRLTTTVAVTSNPAAMCI